MDKFDRELQLLILKAAVDAYPKTTSHEQFRKHIEFYSEEQSQKVLANISYLVEHGLIRMFSHNYLATTNVALGGMLATKDGIDFLLQDGGLGAILKVQTIKLHRETLTAIEDFISLANIPESEKQSIVSKLRQLPADAIEHLTKELVVKGALSLPVALPLIQKFLHLG